MKLPLAIITGTTFALLGALPAAAQSLSNGDYAQCSVYDSDGDFEGFSSDCLERKRARIRRYQQVAPSQLPALPPGQRFRPIQLPQSCPLWANGGHGYSSTMYTGQYGQFTTHIGTFDNMLNGRPCVARSYILPGVP